MALLKLDLLPPRIKQARAKQMMIVSGVVAGLLILSVPAGLWYVKWSTLRNMNAEFKRIETEMKSPEFKGVLAQVAQLEADETAVAKKLAVIDKLVKRQSTWIGVLEALSIGQARAHDLWLTGVSSRELKKSEDKGKIELTIRGMAFSIGSVAEFMDSIRASDFDPEIIQDQRLNPSSFKGQPVIGFVTKLKIKV